jgi:holo-[acyl-carrier protein] synthase
MIIGIGSDLCDIRRIEASMANHGKRFTHRVFTEGERARCEARRNPGPCYARRFAAKEAVVKALGTGIAQGVFWRDIEVVNADSGRPSLRLTGGAATHLARMIPPGHEAHLHLSLTDEPPLAQAFVIIEALPAASET